MVAEVPEYEPPARITVNFVDTLGAEMALTTKDNAIVGNMMEAFSQFCSKDMREMRFRFGEDAIEASKTLREVCPSGFGEEPRPKANER